ncbi:hypothetical protein LTR78_006289 [Recurvomyces mirabilis]|uniref:Uncharacterized protein n=1 Tax=Recurvomyces mirabilis TaxID=574656 RepID=A0AAE0WL65_9PEZI|nr:hypothetical protein LTR78_006289 [Recurvomyces mirabilis]KAK5152178.1 hypothetical protein LTS14_008553 [Recurvomyces mirabilis]
MADAGRPQINLRKATIQLHFITYRFKPHLYKHLRPTHPRPTRQSQAQHIMHNNTCCPFSSCGYCKRPEPYKPNLLIGDRIKAIGTHTSKLHDRDPHRPRDAPAPHGPAANPHVGALAAAPAAQMPRPAVANAHGSHGPDKTDDKELPDDNHGPGTKPKTLTKDDNASSQKPTPVQNPQESAKDAAVAAAGTERSEGAAVHRDDYKETFVDAGPPISPGPRRSPRLSRKRSSEEAELKGSEIENGGSKIAGKRGKK